MTHAGRPKQAALPTREAPQSDRSPLAGSADDATPIGEIEALEALGGDPSWRWYGTPSARRAEGVVKGDSGNRASASPHRTRRRARAAPRPAPPKRRVAH